MRGSRLATLALAIWLIVAGVSVAKDAAAGRRGPAAPSTMLALAPRWASELDRLQDVTPDTVSAGVPDSLEAPVPAEDDSTGGAADRDGDAPADTAQARRRLPDPLVGFDQPRWVMLRSLVVPGWGQLHNGSWIKAGLVAGSEAYMVYRIFDDRGELDRLDLAVRRAQLGGDVDAEEQLVTQYNAQLDQYIGRQWMLGGLLAYALLDAYIDAHFRGFKVQFDEDPALPPGERPSKSVRLSWQEKF